MSDITYGTIAARLERLPVSRWHNTVRIILGICTLFDAYDGVAIAFVLPALVGAWHLTPSEIGLLISSGFAGQLIGASFFGWLAERRGRIFALNLSILILAIFGIACAFAWGFASLAAFRFVQGLGVGGENPVASTYVNEIAKAQRRGRFALLYQLVYPFGFVLAGSVSIWVVPRWGWQYVFIIGAIPALMMIFIQRLVPESPRWLARHGRFAEADAIVSKIERRIYGPTAIPALDPNLLAHPPIPPGHARFSELFHGIYRVRTIMLWVVWFCALMIGYGLLTWLPSVYRTVYHFSIQQSLSYSFVSQVVPLCFSTSAALLIDVIGRRWLFGTAFTLGGLALLPLVVTANPSPALLMVVAGLGMGAIGMTQLSLWTYTPELYPTRMRALGAGVSSSWGRFGSMAAPWMVGLMLGNGYTVNAVYLVFAAAAFIGAATIIIAGPETRHRILEDVSPDFVPPRPIPVTVPVRP
jgi:MFS transporter, putative metabolite:H+ symporter